ncbi:hypothetical protein F5X99DRAFT_263254 [Biscogniauxia marginata]|nr:hypothetical protein F5X99DRAFT_263254 [Biscogniauxia marginata]
MENSSPARKKLSSCHFFLLFSSRRQDTAERCIHLHEARLLSLLQRMAFCPCPSWGICPGIANREVGSHRTNTLCRHRGSDFMSVHVWSVVGFRVIKVVTVTDRSTNHSPACPGVTPDRSDQETGDMGSGRGEKSAAIVIPTAEPESLEARKLGG